MLGLCLGAPPGGVDGSERPWLLCGGRQSCPALSSTDTAQRDEPGGASSISLCVTDLGQAGPQGELMAEKRFGMFSDWQEQTESISCVSVGATSETRHGLSCSFNPEGISRHIQT